MSSASPSSARPSAPTSKPSSTPADDAFLREQADEARAALMNGIGDLKAALAGTVDPRQLPRRFPFITIGAVAVASFAAAVATIPSREQQELKRLERIRRAMYPEPEPVKEMVAEAAGEAAKAAKPALWIVLLREAVNAARPLLINLVKESIKAKQAAAGTASQDPGEPA